MKGCLSAERTRQQVTGGLGGTLNTFNMTLSARVDFTHQMKPNHHHLLVFSPRLTRLFCTHPFIVFERSREAHRLDELCEGTDLLVRVLMRLLHVTELKDKKKKRSGEKNDSENRNCSFSRWDVKRVLRDPGLIST